MKHTPDANWHQQRESDFIAHVTRTLAEPKFVVDTTLGQRAASALVQQSQTQDKSVDLKRQMSQHRPDRALEERMPIGRSLETTFSVSRWWLFQKIVGRLVALAVSPTKAILSDAAPEPMSAGETRRQLSAIPPALAGVPTTIILCSTSGFTLEARELAERTSERAVVLVEPNDAGGWNVHGSTEISGVLEILDPESITSKERRTHRTIDEMADALLGSSLSAEQLVVVTQLPLMTVESAVKSYAAQHTGLTARRLDGRLLLYREGSLVPQGRAVGGEGMTLVDRIKLLLNRKGDTEKKIAFLAERKAALSQQRDAAGDDLFRLEKKEAQLKRDFKATDSVSARRRITGELVQLQKEIQRRQQLQSVVAQQINVVGTHLHNLELIQQGRLAKLPSTDDMATDAAAAEEMLAQLQADSEGADDVSTSALAGMSDEEQALYDALSAESDASVATHQPTSEATPDAVQKSAEPTPTRRATPTGEPG